MLVCHHHLNVELAQLRIMSVLLLNLCLQPHHCPCLLLPLGLFSEPLPERTLNFLPLLLRHARPHLVTLAHRVLPLALPDPVLHRVVPVHVLIVHDPGRNHLPHTQQLLYRDPYLPTRGRPLTRCTS